MEGVAQVEIASEVVTESVDTAPVIVQHFADLIQELSEITLPTGQNAAEMIVIGAVVFTGAILVAYSISKIIELLNKDRFGDTNGVMSREDIYDW